MYVLEKKGGCSVTAALELCVEGRYSEAVAQLEALPAEVRDAPMVQRLRARAERADVYQPENFAATVTACDWCDGRARLPG